MKESFLLKYENLGQGEQCVLIMSVDVHQALLT